MLWPIKQDEYENLQRELFEWTQRLGLRLALLPNAIKDEIGEAPSSNGTNVTDAETITENDETADPSLTYSRLSVQIRMQSFLRLGMEARQADLKSMLIDQDTITIVRVIGSRMEVIWNERNAIVEYRPYNSLLKNEDNAIQQLERSVGSLAAVLGKSEPITTFIPKCCGFFHDTRASRFGLLYQIAAGAERSSPSLFQTLKELLLQQQPHPSARGKTVLSPPQHPLNQRYCFARDLATALLFVHSVGWVHKNINSSNM
jgi:hypothetical protein